MAPQVGPVMQGMFPQASWMGAPPSRQLTPQVALPSMPVHPAAMGSYQSYGSNLLKQVSSAQPMMLPPVAQPPVMMQPSMVRGQNRRHVMAMDNSVDAQTKAAMEWIEAVLAIQRPQNVMPHQWLASGEVLCRLANVVLSASPNPHIRITLVARATDPIPAQRDNARRFVEICRLLGVSESDTFAPADLVDGQNFFKVVNCVACLGGILQNYEWWVNSPLPLLGRRMRIQALVKV